MKDPGKAKYFLGIEIARGEEGFFLTQRKYALDIIEEVGMLDCQPVLTPIEQNHRLLSYDGPLYKDPMQFRRLVEHLVYLANIRPRALLCCSGSLSSYA